MMAPPMPVGHVQEQDWFSVLIRHLEDTGAYWLYFGAASALMIGAMFWFGDIAAKPGEKVLVDIAAVGLLNTGWWLLAAAFYLS